jgi:glycosyltransferase involved in cell wall biosynthesis
VTAVLCIKRVIVRLVRAGLIRYARARPRAADLAGGERRVTILLSSAWGMGGTIRATLNLASQLCDDYEVEIITIYRRREQPFFGAFPPGVTVTPLDDQRPGHEGGRVRRLLRARSSLLVHPSDRLARHFSLRTDLRLARLLRRRTGLLLTTRPAFNLLACRLRLPGVRVVAQEHTNLRQHGVRLVPAMRALYPELDALVVLTAHDARDYRALLGGRIPIYVIPNGVRPLDGPAADLSARTVFTAGRLVWHKGHEMLVRAFADAGEAHPEWSLRICGKGYEKKMLEELIASLDLQRRVSLEGPVQDIGTEMSRASIFALSSRAEGFPIVLLEAMSKGMAVVSFDCPTGPADLIEDHVNGLLVPPMDEAALASALRELMADEALRRRCAAAAVVTAREYRADAVMPRWDAVLDEVWRRGGGHRAAPHVGSGT